MKLDPRTKLLILAITSVSVFLNGSIIVECVFVGLPLLLLFSAGRFHSAVKYGALFLVLLAVQLWLVPVLPVSAGGIVYMFAVYIRKLIPCFMLGSFLISTTRVSKFLAAVGRFLLPKGFTISLSITLRYFPTMKEEWNAVKDAMALRGIPVQQAVFSATLCGQWNMSMCQCWFPPLKFPMKLPRRQSQEELIMCSAVPV